MIKWIINFVIVTMLLSGFLVNAQDTCIEPRNNYSQNTISNIVWADDTSTIYVSTMGQVLVKEINASQTAAMIHQVCPGRFPEVSANNSYYVIGSDFLPSIFVYFSETNELATELNIDSENTHSIAIDILNEKIALSTSAYDADGFFTLDRNIEIREFSTGELLATLVSDNSINLPFDASLRFITPELLLVSGIDQDDTFVELQAVAMTWNWQTGETNQIEIHPDTQIIALETRLLTLRAAGDQIIIQEIPLLAGIDSETSFMLDIEIDNITTVTLSGNDSESLLALTSGSGYIWIVDIRSQEIILQQELTDIVRIVSFDHTGQYLALGYGDGTVEIWDWQTDRIVWTDNILTQ